MNTRNMCLVIVCVLETISSLSGNKDRLKRRRTIRPRYNYFVRCTRRFTPGVCIEPVISVWTFAFQQQNCTERYGCIQDWRTNRFSTHQRCMRRCQPLVDFYTEVLARDARNLTAYQRSQPWNQSGRRDSSDDADGADLQPEEYDQRIDNNVNGPAPPQEDDSVGRNDWAVTVDIDDVVVEAIENDGLVDRDLFHH